MSMPDVMGEKQYTVLVLMVVLMMMIMNCASGEHPRVPCYFIFGDSLADSGNNNLLQTTAKADYPPYGIDFPYGPTGRFCNGRTTVDIIAELLNFDHYIPPFATANSTDYVIVFGLNYASGSAGILDETGEEVGERIPFNMQLENHETTVSWVIELLGGKELAALHLGKCLYSVGMGNNDYINNYFLPQYFSSSHEYTLDQFTEILIQQYEQQLRRLYGYGARKIAIFGLGDIGCTPDAIETYGTNGSACFTTMNTAAQLFNTNLKPVIDQLNGEFTDAKFIYINSSGINAAAAGFTVDDLGCCLTESGGLCFPDTIPCPNRTEYVFWDSFHPTENFNKITAARAYGAIDHSDAYPFDIHHLILLDQGAAAAAAR